ncbi:MAG: hypothetical protein ACK5MD_06160 [Flavobacteriales bacterium]
MFFVLSILISSSFMLNSKTHSLNLSDLNRKSPALVISWKENNLWYACGPIQCVKTGKETEEKALNYVYNNKKDTLKYIEKKDPYKIYSLQRPLKNYDKDIRSRLKQLGISISY